LVEYLARRVAERMLDQPPHDGWVDGLVHPAEGERALSAPEIVMHVLQLVAAATDTTRGAANNLMFSLAREPGLWSSLRGDRALLPAAVGESLRHDSPIQFVLRTAAAEPDVDPARVPEATGAPIRRHRWRDRDRLDRVADQPSPSR
jgi:cytochrome P450